MIKKLASVLLTFAITCTVIPSTNVYGMQNEENVSQISSESKNNDLNEIEDIDETDEEKAKYEELKIKLEEREKEYKSGRRTLSLKASEVEAEPGDERIINDEFEDKEFLKAINKALGKDREVDAEVSEADMKGFTELYIDSFSGDVKVTNIDPIKYCTNLTSLSLNSTDIKNLDAIKDLNLIKLDILENVSMLDLKDLSDMTTLEILYINGLEEIDSENYVITKVPNLINEDLEPLKGLTNLKALGIGMNNIKDISAVSSLTNLESLDLAYNELVDISPVASLKKLDTFSFIYNKVRDVSALGELSVLRLNASMNQIEKFPNFENSFKRLAEMDDEEIKENGSMFVYLKYNNIGDIDGLELLNNEELWQKNKGKISIYMELGVNGIPSVGLLKRAKQYDYFKRLFIDFTCTHQKIVLDEVVKTSKKFDEPIPFRHFNGELPNAKNIGLYTDIAEKSYFTPNTDYISWEVKSDKGLLEYKAVAGDLYDADDDSSSVYINYVGRFMQPYRIETKTDPGGGGSTGGGGGTDPNPPTPSTQATAVIANGEKYTDVLTATVLANEKNCPILLSSLDSVDAQTIAEMKRIEAGDVIISGGPHSVSQKVVDQLKSEGFSVVRFSGPDRYGTAEQIGDEVRAITKNEDEAMLVDGTNFPDVITISTLASQKRAPILITEPETLNKTAEYTISKWNLNDITIGGSYNSVSKNIEDNLGVSKVQRLGGADRYETSKIVGQEVVNLTGNKDNMVLVDGTDFPDGITINSLASKFKSPIMLTNPTQLNKHTADKISEWSMKNVLIGGGYNSVSKEIEDNLKVDKKERVAGQNRYETAVKISQRRTDSSLIGDR